MEHIADLAPMDLRKEKLIVLLPAAFIDISKESSERLNTSCYRTNIQKRRNLKTEQKIMDSRAKQLPDPSPYQKKIGVLLNITWKKVS